MLVHQKTMFDHFYCIVILCLEFVWQNAPKSSISVLPIIARMHEGFGGFKTSVPEQRLTPSDMAKLCS